MKNQFRKLLASLMILFVCTTSFATITTTTVTIQSWGVCNVVVYTPDNASANLPTVFFVPGLGEQTTNVSGLFVHGPLVYIQNGWRPNFNVIGIQPSQGWPGGDFINRMLDQIVP